jgi:hypothetical protein
MLQLVDLKWRKEQGETIAEEEINKKTQELYEVREKEWEAWRREHYVLTEERRQQEITLSYPRVEKDIFE